MLSSCRALDLTDEKGFLCGKILGDLGAGVIKIEPPTGDPARNVGPFCEDIPPILRRAFTGLPTTPIRAELLILKEGSII